MRQKIIKHRLYLLLKLQRPFFLKGEMREKGEKTGLENEIK